MSAGRDDREGHLEEDEDRLRDGSADRVDRHALEEEFVQIADKSSVAAGGQAVAIDHPEDAHDRGDGQALNQDGKDVLGPDQATVEEGEPRQGHEQDEDGGGDHPGGVPAADHSLGLLGEGG